jgi:hypothetical protein
MLGFLGLSVVSAVFSAATAFADPKDADGWYKEGENQYILGEYVKAAEAFKAGFALETQDNKKPAYIYNVAQSYRQAKMCTEAVFFYKRFLQMKADGMGKPLSDTRRQETEQLIAEAETCAKSADSTAAKKPEGTMKPDGSTKAGAGGTTTTGGGTTAPKTGGGATTTTGGGGGTTTTAGGGGTTTAPKTGGGGTTTTTGGGGGTTTTAGGGGTTTTAGGGGTTTDTHKTDTKVANNNNDNDNGENDDDNDNVRRHHGIEPKLVDARGTLGGSHISAGPDVPMQFSFALVGGYPIKVMPKLRVYPGAALILTPIPYKNAQLMNSQSTASFTQLLANVGATYEVMPKISARGDLGLGLLFFGGIQDMGNPFTVNEQSTTGTLAMFNLRIAVSGDYDINKNLFVTATPFAFSFSPAKSGLQASSITTINFSVGAGYRM